MIKRNCKLCKKELYTCVSRIKRGRGKYCSKECSNIDKKGKRCSPNTEFKKGQILTKECKDKISKTLKKINNGSNNPAWKGGKFQNCTGYVFVHSPNHSFNRRGYVKEHRLVMEKYIGRYLNPKEVVHHINRIRNDNRIKNLMLFKDSIEHIQYHNFWDKHK